MFALKLDENHNLDPLFHVFNHVTDLVFVMKVDEKGHFRYEFTNESAKAYAGFTEDVTGKTITEVMPAEVAEEIIEHYEHAVRSGESIVYEDSNADSFYESKITPFFDDNGNCTHVIAIVRDVSERKRKENELKVLRDRYKSLFDHNFNGVYSIDLRGVITSVNKPALKIMGYEESELIGKKITSVMVRSYIEPTKIAFFKAASGEAYRFDSAIHHKDGHIIYVTATNVPIYVDGQVVGVYGIFADQTEKIMAEKALTESEERYRRLVDMSPEGIVVHRAGRILYANSYAQKIMKDSKPVGKSIFSFIHPDDHSIAKERIWHGEIGTEIPYMEIKVVRSDDVMIYTETVGTLISYNGKPAIMSIFRDVTDRKRIEQALRESEEKYRLIANNMTDLVLIIDTTGYIKYASPSHETVLGFTPDLFIGKHALEYIHPDNSTQLAKAFHQVVTSKQTIATEIRHKHANGSWTWVEAKISPVLDDEGSTHHTLVVARVITERKVLEEKLTFMAYHDTLTGLPNRRKFKDTLDRYITRAEAYDQKLAVLYLDVDYFKIVNDHFGHDIGDELLIQFSKRVQSCLKPKDCIARLGGDEFCVLLEINAKEDAINTAQKIISSLQQEWVVQKFKLRTTSSIGIAIFEKGFDSESFIKAADIALYKAKEKGRNNYQLYRSVECL